MITDTLTITPQDFDNDARDWSAGALRHVVAQIIGTPVVVITNRDSGMTYVGVTVVGMNMVKGLHYLVLDFGSHHANVWLNDLGAITPLTKPQAKWDAMRTYKAEVDAALAWVRARHSITATGTLLAFPAVAGVRVHHRTDDGLTANWTVSLALLDTPV
jgi:hypothetical protein